MAKAGYSGLPQPNSGGAEGGLFSRKSCRGNDFGGDDGDEGNLRLEAQVGGGLSHWKGVWGPRSQVVGLLGFLYYMVIPT